MSNAEVKTILHAFSTFKLGGPQARFVALANHFGSDYRHIIIAMDNQFAAADLLEPQVNFELMPLTVQKGGAFANRRGFRQLLKQLKPDLVLSYNWGAIEWALANVPKICPQVHVEDGFGPEEAIAQLPRRVLTRKLLFWLTSLRLVVPSRLLSKIAAELWQVPANKWSYIANGVDLPPAAKVLSTSGPITIGTVAAIRKEKNITRLIQAFAIASQHHELRLVIVGDGPELVEIKALVSGLRLDALVTFTGYQKKPTEFLQQFDLFALSSDTEQLPIAMLEAMAAGLPVIATQVGDVPSIFANTVNPYIAKIDDADFTSTLLDAIANRAQWPEIGANNRQIIEKEYALKQMQAAWQQVFDTGNV